MRLNTLLKLMNYSICSLNNEINKLINLYSIA